MSRVPKNLDFVIANPSGGCLRLPPLWQLIYQEAILANHLLFDPCDLLIIEDDQGQKETELAAYEMDELIDTVIGIIHCSDLTSMKKIILTLPVSKKKALFKIYKNALISAGFMIKRNLN